MKNFPQWHVNHVNTWSIPAVLQISPAIMEGNSLDACLREIITAINDNATALHECQEFMRWIAAAEPEVLDRWRASLVAERLTNA